MSYQVLNAVYTWWKYSIYLAVSLNQMFFVQYVALKLFNLTLHIWDYKSVCTCIEKDFMKNILSRIYGLFYIMGFLLFISIRYFCYKFYIQFNIYFNFQFTKFKGQSSEQIYYCKMNNKKKHCNLILILHLNISCLLLVWDIQLSVIF